MASLSSKKETDVNNRILCMGLLCLDNVYVLPEYPVEDADVRALSQTKSRGGNASTNTAILAQLGWENVEFLGSVGDSMDSDFCLDDLRKYGVIVENCVKREGLIQPNTCAIINESNGSRTLVHYHGGFPEITSSEFSALNLNQYKLIHLEGRNNVDELAKMLKHISVWNSTNSHHKLITSLEVEKPRDYSHLIAYPDVLFISSEYARNKGYTDMHTTILGVGEYAREGSLIVCAWGSEGASAGIKRSPMTSEDIVSVSAFPPVLGVKDTLGAGDCFVAACLYALMSIEHTCLDKDTVSRVIKFGCRVAGYKCGQYGFHLKPDVISQFKQEL